MATQVDDDSLAGLGHKIADHAAELVKKEIELAKAEIIGRIKKAAIGVGVVSAALLFLLYALGYLLATIPAEFGPALFHNNWLGWILFGLIFLIVAGVLGFIGIRVLIKTFKEKLQVVASIKEDVEWLKQLSKRNTTSK